MEDIKPTHDAHEPQMVALDLPPPPPLLAIGRLAMSPDILQRPRTLDLVIELINKEISKGRPPEVRLLTYTRAMLAEENYGGEAAIDELEKLLHSGELALTQHFRIRLSNSHEE